MAAAVISVLRGLDRSRETAGDVGNHDLFESLPPIEHRELDIELGMLQLG